MGAASLTAEVYKIKWQRVNDENGVSTQIGKRKKMRMSNSDIKMA